MNDKITPNNGLTNVFIDMNQVPYLLGEYFDNSSVIMIDKSSIQEGVYIDCESNPLMPYVDININHIGWKPGGGNRLNTFGNLIRQRQVMDFTIRNKLALANRFDVIRSGILVRISYRLSNMRTRQVIRSLTEDIRINNRQYYSDFPDDDKEGLVIISNFMQQKVSQINSFTHGNDPLSLTISRVELFYEMVDRRVDCHHGGYNPNHYYDLHSKCQPVQVDGYNTFNPYNHYSTEIANPSWTMMNRLYRFEREGREIALHNSEIYDSLARIRLMPCGELKLNHSFMINPGARIVFKLNIWKSDISVFSDTRGMASAIGETCIPTAPPIQHQCGCHHHKPDNAYPDIDSGFTHPGDAHLPPHGGGLNCYSTPQQIVAEMNRNTVYDIQQQMQIDDINKKLNALVDYLGIDKDDMDKDDADDLLDDLFSPDSDTELDSDSKDDDTVVPDENDEVEDSPVEPVEPEVSDTEVIPPVEEADTEDNIIE